MRINKQLIGAIAIAHILLFLCFYLFSEVFWLLFTLSLLTLALLSYKSTSWKRVTFNHIVIGFGSGVLLYLVFFIGKQLMLTLFPTMITDLQALYELIAPKENWHYVSLILVIIPAEELFWRGYVQRNLEKSSLRYPVVLAAVLYMSAHLYAGALLLLVAALMAGMVWGYLYKRTGTMTVPLLSHLVFDLLLLVFFPLL